MSFAVHIPKPIKNRITSWNLPASVHQGVYRHLIERLGSSGINGLSATRCPLKLFGFGFRIAADGGDFYHFFFDVEENVVNNAVVVRDCGCMKPASHKAHQSQRPVFEQ